MTNHEFTLLVLASIGLVCGYYLGIVFWIAFTKKKP